MSDKLPDFLVLEQALERINADHTASEAQGMACGMLAVQRETRLVQWLKQVLPSAADAQDVYVQEAAKMLTQLFEHAKNSLNSNELAFEMLLPPEEFDLDERVYCLQQWCQGVAFGVAASGLKTLTDLKPTAKEWFEDMVKIGASGEMDVTDEDESEAAFEELKSFLSVGILMFNEENQPIVGKPHQAQDTLH
ncbi:UPF0149 family protein [Thiofilum flexile]|uniref:UPF0149 family protein n=1 Tax=Thiofilum flexile TaxID=125627 RepID=UPI00036556A1|nr:YecA family protein [Thiofilum flexile]